MAIIWPQFSVVFSSDVALSESLKTLWQREMEQEQNNLPTRVSNVDEPKKPIVEGENCDARNTNHTVETMLMRCVKFENHTIPNQ